MKRPFDAKSKRHELYTVIEKMKSGDCIAITIAKDKERFLRSTAFTATNRTKKKVSTHYQDGKLFIKVV